ncbi:MAG: aminotransferase class IV [Caldilineaceae bacterium]
MSRLQLFAVTAAGPQPCPVSATATDFTDLYAGLHLGVYTSLRTFHHNQFLDLAHHLARTVNSMRLLGWEYELDEPRLRHALDQLCRAYPTPELRVRIDVLAEPATLLGVDSRELIALMPFTPLAPTYYTEGVAVGFAAQLQRQNPLIKVAEFALQRKQAEQADALYEHLLLNEQGEILEATSANFYAVRDGLFYTAGAGVLAGVTRGILLQLVQGAGIPLKLQAIHTNELATLDEAMISSSSRGILPVVRIGDQPIGNGRPGPVTQQLIRAYGDYVEAHIQPAIEAS